MSYGFIIDLDGTMYAGSRPVPDAASFIQRLREKGWPYVYATNNSSRTPEQVAAHLQHVCGIDARAEEVATTAQAAASYIAEQHGGRRVYMIGEAGLREALLDGSLELTDDDPFAGEAAPVDFVVQGIDRSFTYEKMCRAVAFIRSGARYVLTNPDHLLPSDHGLMPGAGSIGASIEKASGQAPVIIGKPSRIMMDFAARRLGLPPDRIWAVGDNVRTDIGGGINAGFRTALVLTGLATPDNVHAQIADSGVKPELISSDLLQFLNRLQGNLR